MNTYNTRVFPFDKEKDVYAAHHELDAANVVAVPTDTVYGLMAGLDYPAAIQEIYAIKGRPLEKAIPVLIADYDQIDRVAQLKDLGDRQSLMQVLAERFWPGPLTLIVPANETLPDILTAGQKTVAIRMPNHHLLRQLLRMIGPAAATSANLSGQSETIVAPEVMVQLGGRIPAIFDGGSCAGGIGSTIVDLTGASGNQHCILRPGPLEDAITALLQDSTTNQRNQL